MESPGKILMKTVWRFQQVGGIVSVALMCLNLTVPLYGYTHWRFYNIGITSKYDWLIYFILFIFTFSLALSFGIMYDRIFKLWKHHQIVAAERNPFNKGRINPNELVTWQYLFIPLLLKRGLKEEALFNLKWNEINMDLDPELRNEVFRIIDWINTYKLKDVDERWIMDITKATKRKYIEKYGKVKPDW